MNKNTEYCDLTLSANGISTVCPQNDALSFYDIYYINPRLRMNSCRLLLIRKKGFLRTGAMEFIFSQTWSG